MTKQVLLPRESTNVETCRPCKYYRAKPLFELCEHEQAVYGGKMPEFHPCQYMRASSGPCGQERRLAR